MIASGAGALGREAEHEPRIDLLRPAALALSVTERAPSRSMYRDDESAALARATAAYEALDEREVAGEVRPSPELSALDLVALAERLEAKRAPRHRPSPWWSLLLPWRRTTLRSRLSAEAAGDAIRELLAAQLVVGVEHVATPGAFTLERAIDHRNSFLPVARIRVVEEGQGSTVEVRMSLPVVTAVFLTLWMTLATTIGLGAIRSGGSPFVLGFPVFGAFLYLVGYTPEVRRLEALLASAVGRPR